MIRKFFLSTVLAMVCLQAVSANAKTALVTSKPGDLVLGVAMMTCNPSDEDNVCVGLRPVSLGNQTMPASGRATFDLPNEGLVEVCFFVNPQKQEQKGCIDFQSDEPLTVNF